MGSKFNASLYAYQMKNCFREFYADKLDLAQTAKEELGAPAGRQLSDVDLTRRVAFMLSDAVHQQQQDQQRLPRTDQRRTPPSTARRSVRRSHPAARQYKDLIETLEWSTRI